MTKINGGDYSNYGYKGNFSKIDSAKVKKFLEEQSQKPADATTKQTEVTIADVEDYMNNNIYSCMGLSISKADAATAGTAITNPVVQEASELVDSLNLDGVDEKALKAQLAKCDKLGTVEHLDDALADLDTAISNVKIANYTNQHRASVEQHLQESNSEFADLFKATA